MPLSAAWTLQRGVGGQARQLGGQWVGIKAVSGSEGDDVEGVAGRSETV